MRALGYKVLRVLGFEGMRFLGCKVLLAVFLSLSLVSCERRPLEVQNPEGQYCDILLLTDWRLLDDTPTGLTAMFFPEDGGTPTIVMSNNTVGNVIRLNKGRYKMLVFNQSIYEFGSMAFSDIEKFETIKARLVSLSDVVTQETVSDYNWIKQAVHGNPDSLMLVVRNPEAFNADRMVYEVTDEMCKRQWDMEYGDAANPWGDVAKRHYIDTIHSTPPPVAPTMHITINVKGIDNAYSVRAYISNMARSDLFGPHRNTEEEAIHVISNWKIQVNPDDPTRGKVTTSFHTFGTPSMQVTQNDIFQTWGSSRSQSSTRDSGNDPQSSTRGSGITLDTYGNNRLYIEFLLHDGTTVVQEDFDVSEDITYDDDQLLLDVELDMGATLPDVPDQMGAGGAGFDADVEDWKNQDEDIIF